MSVSISVLNAFSVFGHVDAVYSEAKEKQGDTFPAGLKYIYSAKTSNTSLRPHLERVHLQLYMEQKELRGWMIPASRRSGPSAITCVSNGLTGGTGSGFIDGELGMW